MTKIKYRFKGHESFILREGWLNKGMREVRNDPFVFSQNYGADVLGVGPNMAKAIRYWMRTCGLLDERGKQGVFLSKLGEQIWEYDKYLREIIYVFLTIFLYLLKCPQSLILSALRAFCFCGKPHISRSIFLYFRYQAWLKSW